MRKQVTVYGLLAVSLGLAVAAVPAAANEGGDSWSVYNAPGERISVSLDVDEGTWMSLDVSPDGTRIAFDLLGDIFTLPITGGEARPLAVGAAWDMQPRYSPDGSHIAFTSDRGGGDNIWVMNANGAKARAITRETFRTLNNPTWSADGNYLAARKHYSTTRSLASGEIWLYHLAGGDGVPLVERPSVNHEKELGEPMFSADGKALYFSRNVTPGDVFIYAQNSNAEVFQIKRYDVASGDVSTAVGGAGGAVRPTPSPDGKYLAFVRRLRENSALFVKHLESGRVELLYRELDRDMQEGWAVQGVYPNMDWTPDSQSLVFWAGGKIRRVNVVDKSVRDIPFRVRQQRQVLRPARSVTAVAPDTFTTKMVRWPTVSPDGETVVFESLGRLYSKRLPDGKAKPLTRGGETHLELFPSWSRDGKWVVFASWHDETLGAVYKVSARGGKAEQLSREPGHFRRPRFSPDGKMVVVEKGAGGRLTTPQWSENPGIYVLPATGGALRRVTNDGQDPHFAGDGERLFLTRLKDTTSMPQQRNAGGERHLVSIDLNGQDERDHAFSPRATRLLVAPGGDWLAIRENYHVYVVPMPASPAAVEVGPVSAALPVRKLSVDGGQFPAWVNGDQLSWSMGPGLFTANVRQRMHADNKTAALEAPAVDISMAVDADKPKGMLALNGAKVVTMDAAQRVIERATILVRDNRIVAIAAQGDIEIPATAVQVDVSGKTIIPGLIDVHGHGLQGEDELLPQQNWSNLAYLALGVTTMHDPAHNASQIFSAAELQRAGRVLAPRLYSSGEIVYGARSSLYAIVDNLDDARGHVRRLQSQGALTIKNYNQPRREQRQQINTAARELGMMVVAEGGSLFHLDMTHISDGITGVEHNVPLAMLYADVMQLWSQTPVGYTLTLNVNFGGLSGEDYWYQHTDVWKHPLLSRFVPPHILQPRAIRRLQAPETDYSHLFASAANGKRLAEAGVNVNIGGHGQREGLGGHWEMWSFVKGGMSPMQALHTATLSPARYLGLDADIGSLEAGKLADLLILNADPLQDIRNSDAIDKVMLNGRLYDAQTLGEEVTGNRKLRPLYWWDWPQAELTGH